MWEMESSPHPRGDGPANTDYAVLGFRFSPPAWGWSDDVLGGMIGQVVLPTRVGMVRI